ncbi:MAG: ABC transporter permease [Acidimicrobiales bacterium]
MMLALQEIRRSKVRFGLLSGAVGLLIFLILFQQALLGGLIRDFIGAVDNQNSPILVFNEDARQNVEGSFLFPDQVAEIAMVDGVGVSSPIGQGTFTVLADSGLEDAVIFGYELGSLGEPQTVVEGRLPEGPNEAVASEADAENGFDIGDTVTVVGDAADLDITVVGLAEDTRWSVSATLFVSYETFGDAQRVVNPSSELILPSLVAVEPQAGVSEQQVIASIETEVGGVEALTKQEAVDQSPGVQSVNQSFQIVLALAFLVVALVVGFFFLILTVQKAKALTLLRAIGSPSSYLVKNLLFQILLVLGLGSLVGLLLTVALVSLAPPGDLSVSVEPSSVALTLGGIVVLALLGGIASIRRVLRIDPISATTTAGANS